MKRTIDVKDNRQTEELSAEIKELRNAVKLLEEKVAENRDMLENYLKEHSDLKENVEELKSEPEELEQPVENYQEIKNREDIKQKDENDDAITSDI